MRDYNYYKSACTGLPMPFAYVDLDLLEENMKLILQHSNGKNIRLASKSIRSVAILRRILDYSDQFQGIMCYDAREAVDLAQLGFTDLLIGYPIWHEGYIRNIAHTIKNGALIILMIDSPEHVHHIERIAKEEKVRIPICIDIDLSLIKFGLRIGVYRSPIRTIEQLRTLLETIQSCEYVFVDGIMGYEAQVAGVYDNAPKQWVKNTLVRWLKRLSIQEYRKYRAETLEELKKFGITPRFVNGGGTGSLHITSLEESVTEVTAGSGFYSPTLFDHYRDFHFHPAVGFAIEIVRIPEKGYYTCSGGGYIASGAAGRDKLPSPYLPEGATLIGLEGAGEVQTPIHYQGNISLKHGDPIFMRHSKSGELCERFSHLYCIAGGQVVDQVTTYRGDGKCYL